MKTTKKLFLVLICIALSLCMFACSGGDGECKNHADANGDGICESCGKVVEKQDDGSGDNGENTGNTEGFVLIKDGVPTFQIVMGDIPLDAQFEIGAIKTALKKLGITVEVVKESDGSDPKDVEVLVGNVKNRGDEYVYDTKVLGPKGKAIKLVGTKLILVGGSESKLLDVIDEFKEDILGIEKDTQTLQNVVVTNNQLYEKPQTEFDYSSVTIGAKDAKGYTIKVDTKVTEAYNTALKLQNYFYEKAGYWFDVEPYSDNTAIPADSVVIRVLPNTGVGNGYKTYVNGNSLVIETEFRNDIEEATDNFLVKKISIQDDKLVIDSKVAYTEDVRSLYYSDYCKENGIELDTRGIKNAYSAMYAVHEYANLHGYTVCAKSNEKFLITETNGVPIKIKTNVDWGLANIIVDDRNFEVTWKQNEKTGKWDWERPTDARIAVFEVLSDYSSVTLDASSDIVKAINEAGGINQTTTNNNTDFFGLKSTDFGKDYKKVMIIPKNANHKVYIRYGGNANSGSAQEEFIILDENGKIDESTPFLLDYTEVTSLRFFCVDDTPITLSGGVFTTRANKAPCSYSAGFTRNLQVKRSNTTLMNIVHKITDEGETGSCYSGFFQVNNLNNFTMNNCTVQAHRMYYDEVLDDTKSTPDTLLSYGTSMGTYELSGSMANNLYYVNCKQSNFYDPDGNATSTWYDEYGNTALNNMNKEASIWGVMGSNYCKNITYDNCTLNRIDAHAGVINVAVKNDSKVISVRLIGGGTALFENSTIYKKWGAMIELREDYGSTWNGDVVIRNMTLVTSETTPTLISGVFANHYFGYTTYIPNIIVDGFKLEGNSATTVNIFNNFSAKTSEDDITADTYQGSPNVNKMVLPEKIVITNNKSGYKFNVAPDGCFLSGALKDAIKEE